MFFIGLIRISLSVKIKKLSKEYNDHSVFFHIGICVLGRILQTVLPYSLTSKHGE